MTRPTCANCTAWFCDRDANGRSRRGPPICIHRLSPRRFEETDADDTCTHHTPTARDAGTEDGNGE